MWIEPSPLAAFVWLILSPAVFIGCIYIKRIPGANRNDPLEIKRRIKNIGITCLIWTTLLYIIFQDTTKAGPNVFTWIGIQLSLYNYIGILSISALTIVFYTGPLYQSFFTDEGSSELGIMAVRAYIFAPIYEELIFRSCSITVLLAGGWGLYQSVLLGCLSFGLSHLYHLVEAFRAPKHARNIMVMSTLFQSCFTSVFGFYTGFLFVTTGSLYGTILVHSFCNYMGLPDISFMRENSPSFRYRWHILIAYIVGIAGFIILVQVMMRPELFKSWHYQLYLSKREFN